MSREELVGAYLDGGISRRMFIKRLVAAGTSLGAAVSYAHLLAPEAKAASGRDGDGIAHYEPEIKVVIRSARIRRVLARRVLEVAVSSDDSATFTLRAQIRHKGRLRTVGTKQVVISAATADRIVSIPVSKAGREALAGRDASWVKVAATAVHQQAQPQAAYTSSTSATKVLLG